MLFIVLCIFVILFIAVCYLQIVVVLGSCTADSVCISIVYIIMLFIVLCIFVCYLLLFVICRLW